jgi:hypothetical protein
LLGALDGWLQKAQSEEEKRSVIQALDCALREDIAYALPKIESIPYLLQIDLPAAQPFALSTSLPTDGLYM